MDHYMGMGTTNEAEPMHRMIHLISSHYDLYRTVGCADYL